MKEWIVFDLLVTTECYEANVRNNYKYTLIFNLIKRLQ